ncbi:unnamed protein product [Tuber melanosporum]|uniref:(Perigord truffle) hypothetical protein n=1 Tax=Tuber melanosporum (strain Mel28) TaxID=656061 RepID=D5G7X7_TUBMM|nr:uncharacterized protein GSTUM_00002623001 [Tuber melanosporum]CAZ80620.1 unnamed protein product [Tuber melanosporum]
MITIANSRHVRIWWAMNSPKEPMDLLFCVHRADGEAGTPPPGNIVFAPRNNRGTPSDESADSDDDGSSDGHQPESSARAAKRVTRPTTKTKNTSRNTGQTLRRGTVDVDEPELDSNVSADRGRNLATRVMPALNPGFAPSPGKQVPAPSTDLGTRVLRSGGQIGRGTDRKKASRLRTQTAVNSSPKCNLAAITDADEPNSPADAAEPPRNVARRVTAINTSIESELDRVHGEVNPSRRPTTRPITPNSPPLASNPSHNLASDASEQVQVRASAEHLLMLASGTQQPADTSATQVSTPSRSHSPPDPSTSDVLVSMSAAEAGRELSPAANSPASSSRYPTPEKLRLQLPGFSSATSAASSTAVSAETDVGSPLRFVSDLRAYVRFKEFTGTRPLRNLGISLLVFVRLDPAAGPVCPDPVWLIQTRHGCYRDKGRSLDIFFGCFRLVVFSFGGLVFSDFPGSLLQFFTHRSCSFAALVRSGYLCSSSFRLVALWFCADHSSFLAVFRSQQWFAVAPFIAFPIPDFHLIPHLLGLSGSLYLLRLASQALSPSLTRICFGPPPPLADLLELD